MKSKRVIILCYGFPPNTGIGGRRWAKFAKYLAKKSWQVEVVCKKNTSAKISTWENDVAQENIRRHFIKSNYPKKETLQIPPRSTSPKAISFRLFHRLKSRKAIGARDTPKKIRALKP